MLGLFTLQDLMAAVILGISHRPVGQFSFDRHQQKLRQTFTLLYLVVSAAHPLVQVTLRTPAVARLLI